ncbi:hypothetical protein AK830_g11106 [Neonectria ditissima]|uniref:Isochorismatase-like domain-containing protein n=1 Tax=Neonectria ditissima TaxID=78410 RepID=A0A0P7B5R7_9HYPO|nr:hypothetical protein AK830_g11106 [Neonectria ditissima]
MADLKATFNAADPSTPGHYGPSQTALLLLDFHTMFVEKLGGPKATAALVAAAQLRTWAKARGILVVHALVDVDATPSPTLKGAERFNSVVGVMKSEGAGEHEELLRHVDESDLTFTRTPGRVSALSSPGLSDALQQRNIKSLILTGLSTSGCVLRTTIPATEAGFVVTVISDACADRKQNVHDVAVEDIFPMTAHVTTATEFQEGYKNALESK